MFQVENTHDYNQLLPPRERRGLFWHLAGPVLGLSAPAEEPVHPAIAKMRRYQAALEAANAPVPAPTPVLDVVADAVANVIEMAKPLTPRERATAWLLAELQHGPVAATDIEESAKADGHALKTVRRAFKAMGGRPQRSGGAWWWMLPGQDGRAG